MRPIRLELSPTDASRLTYFLSFPAASLHDDADAIKVLRLLLSALPIGFGLVAVTAMAAVGARRTGMPTSILLSRAGLVLGRMPLMRRVDLRPDLVLSLLLPPLL